MITCQDTLFDMQPFTDELRLEISPANQTGTVSEIAFGHEAAKRGYSIWLPWGHAYKSDLIIWKPPDRPLLVQVKTGTVYRYGNNGYGYRAMAGSGKPSCALNNNDYGLRYTRYQRGDFNVFAMYVPEMEVFCFYSNEEIVEGATSVRWKPGESSNNWHLLEMLSKELT